MGIKDLAKVIADHAERAVREADMKAFFGRKVAIDASMSLYQFLIAVRQDGAQLVNDKGETTRCVHLSMSMCENRGLQSSQRHVLSHDSHDGTRPQASLRV